MKYEPEILLVEDNAVEITLIVHALDKIFGGSTVRIARSSEEALTMLLGTERQPASWSPRLILLDLHLPGADGLELLQRLRAEKRTRLLPVVMLTASRDESHILESYRLGANSYLIKPVDYVRLEQMLEVVGTFWLRYNQDPLLMSRPERGAG